MTHEVNIRPYQTGDEEKIVNLLIDVFNGWPRFNLSCTPLDHWKWKYLDNPFKKCWVVVAETRGKIVGCSHAIPIIFKVGDREYYSSHGYDLAVHSDYRGLGLSTRMHELRHEIRGKDGVEFAHFETGSSIHRKTLEKRYPSFPHKVSLYARISDLGLHFENSQCRYKWFKKTGFRFFKKINALMGLSQPRKTSNINIIRKKSLPEKINNFWEINKRQYKYAVRKDRDYLNWRYFDRRGGEYVVYFAVEENDVLGYIVLRINRYDVDYPVGFIVDLQTIIIGSEIAEMLLVKATMHFDDNDINCIYAYFVDGHSYTKLLQKIGFFNTLNHLYLFYYLYDVADEEFEKVIDSPSGLIWYCYGDRDLI